LRAKEKNHPALEPKKEECQDELIFSSFFSRPPTRRLLRSFSELQREGGVQPLKTLNKSLVSLYTGKVKLFFARISVFPRWLFG
jgi:hypothetical protein